MNWYKESQESGLVKSLKDFLKTDGLVNFLNNMGFDSDGHPKKYPPRTKEEQEAHEKWKEEDKYDHMPA